MGITNFYHCPHCGVSWHDHWTCVCNDECPKCGREIEPEEYRWDDEDEDNQE